MPRELCIHTAITLERRINSNTKWSQPQWSVYSVIVNETAGQASPPTVVHNEDGVRRYLFSGLALRLYRDGCEGYWYNLLSEQPRIFVVCDGEYGDEELGIAFVTANQDKATGLMESERMVLSIEMPEKMRDLMERYVVAHYRPEIKKKRKRRTWAEESEYAQKS